MNREIGGETPDVFFLYVRRRLRRRMPIYNKMYTAAFRDIDPLVTFKSTSTGESESSSTASSESSSDSTAISDSKGRGVSSNNPHMQLKASGDYANAIADSIGNTIAETDGTATANELSEGSSSSSSSTEGYSGIPGELIAAHIDTIVDIDSLVVQELSVCFMKIWNTGSSYFR